MLVREGGAQRTLKGGLRSRVDADAYLAAWHVEREAASGGGIEGGDQKEQGQVEIRCNVL